MPLGYLQHQSGLKIYKDGMMVIHIAFRYTKNHPGKQDTKQQKRYGMEERRKERERKRRKGEGAGPESAH